MNLLCCFALLVVLCSVSMAAEIPQRGPARHDPKLDWWQLQRFGMFIHWGPVAITGEEISWSRANSNSFCPNHGKTPVDVYDNLYKQFNPTKFDARAWAKLAKNTGMKYLVLTVKHCDGFLLWDSKTIDYTIMHTPFARDVTRELADACKAEGIVFCVYFSTEDWKDPDCRHPQNNPRFIARMHEQLRELLTQYDVPLIWFDFDGFPGPSEPRETAEFVRKLRPDVIFTNRLEPLHSDESHCLVTPYGDYATPEQFVGSYCDKVPWETCMTICQQWSFRPNDKLKSLNECLKALVNSVGGDGNLLFNVGPMASGEIEPRQVERLNEMGQWVRANGEAIYATRGGPFTPSSKYVSTRTENAIYLHLFHEAGATIALPALPIKVQKASRLDGSPVKFDQSDSSLTIHLEESTRDAHITIVKLKVDGNPLTLSAIYPPSKSGSLAYRKPVRTSSSLSDLFMHDGGAVVDDNEHTRWTTGRDPAHATNVVGHRFEHFQNLPTANIWQKTGWLEVDLLKQEQIARFTLREHVYPNHYAPVKKWKLETRVDNDWQIAAEGTTIGKVLEVPLKAPIDGRWIRLSVESDGRPAIAEIGVFPAGK